MLAASAYRRAGAIAARPTEGVLSPVTLNYHVICARSSRARSKKFQFEISIRLKFFKTNSQSLVQANRHGNWAGAVEAMRSARQ